MYLEPINRISRNLSRSNLFLIFLIAICFPLLTAADSYAQTGGIIRSEALLPSNEEPVRSKPNLLARELDNIENKLIKTRPKTPWQKQDAGDVELGYQGKNESDSNIPARSFKFSSTDNNGTALLNFSNAKLGDVLLTISEITGKNFIISPGVPARNISIHTTKPVQRKDVFGIFETILEVNGLSAVKTGDYYTIVTPPAAKQRGLKLYTKGKSGKLPRGDSRINFLIPIKFISAEDVVKILKPALSTGGNIAHYSKGNTLIITDIASNIIKFKEIIAALDIDAFERLNVSLIPVEHVYVNTLSKELSEIFKTMGYGKESNQLYVIPISRLNSLVVFSSNKELLESAKGWIKQFDTQSPSDETSVHIYYVKNNKAATIKSLLDKLFGGNKSIESSAIPVSKSSGVKLSKKAKKSTVYSSDQGADKSMDIIVFEPSNALVIRSSQREYQHVLKTIHELDQPPSQVLIDALVVEVVLDESMKYGIQWSHITGNVGINSNTGIFSTTVPDPGLNIPTPIGLAAPTGLNILATDAKSFFAFIQALASEGKINVLSNPHVLVRNYGKASITVGSDEPIATQSSQTSVTEASTILQSIEYRKTGIILTVSPQIMEGGMVSMTVRQEISDISTSRVVGDGTFPSFSKREAETSVVTRDNVPIVIAGLIDSRENTIDTGVPLLRRLPLLGKLFQYSSITNKKTELLILITPRVITNVDDANIITNNLKEKLNGLKELLDRAEQNGPVI